MPEKVLVAYASKYGATREIAERIAQVINQSGLEADILPAGQVQAINAYGAVILGSASYIGNWRKEAVAFIRKFDDDMEKKPAWIFSSGPLEDGDALAAMKGWLYPSSLAPTIERINPRGVTVFHGAVDFSKMNFLERWMMKNFKLTKSDFRRWDLVEAWAGEIAASLKNRS
jgi:menaquinone-dependent protoporphyrinogen oxidase